MGTIINLEDVRQRALRRLPRFVFDFVDGGAEDEVTIRANRQGFERLTFAPRMLVDVAERDLSTTVLGQTVKLPVLLSPTGMAALVHPGGEVAVAKAAGQAGTIFAVSTAASATLEEVAAAATMPLWFQLYPWRDREFMLSIMERAQKSGYKAMCTSVDLPVPPKRDRDLHNNITMPLRITWDKVASAATRPGWLWGFLSGPPLTMKNFNGTGEVRKRSPFNIHIKASDQLFLKTTWDDIKWMRDLWKGPFLIKGILTPEDARIAVEHGVDGMIVSNHGGRALDGAPATIDVLPEIVNAVGGRAEVFVDGGIRRGSDVVKALALGARACLIGRPYVFGLASGGEPGVARVLEILREEISTTIALLGRRSVADLDRSVLRLER